MLVNGIWDLNENGYTGRSSALTLTKLSRRNVLVNRSLTIDAINMK